MKAPLGGDISIPLGHVGIHIHREAATIAKLLSEVTGVDDPASSAALGHAEARLRALISTIELIFEVELEDGEDERVGGEEGAR